MTKLSTTVFAALLLLSGCDAISPFVGEELKTQVCDRDHDGFARVSEFCLGEDCDDGDASVGAPTGWFRDVDLDTYGAGQEEFSCSQPVGFTAVTGDCDDTNADISPGGVETCNDVDDDCDGEVDEQVIPTWYQDEDLDSYGNPEVALVVCDQPDGYVADNTDCDDTDATAYPSAPESCDGADNDCDGEVDEEVIPTWYQDEDEDSWGDPLTSLFQCEAPVGWVDNAQDCDDTSADVNPDGVEICDDGIDEDCNGVVDDAEGSQIWYADADGDGYGDVNTSLYSCLESVAGSVLDTTDCDDTNADVNPAAREMCRDTIDNNCDGVVDTDAVDIPWYADADEDGYGDASVSITDCATPDGYVEDAQDCNDTDSLVNPGVEEVCNNGVDDNCDESPNACELSGSSAFTSADVTIESVGFYDYTGWAIAERCDIDGNGQGDLVVSAPYDDYGVTDSGSVFIFYDGTLTSSIIASSDADIMVVGGIDSDHTGSSLACGDVDRDGVDDLLIGVPGNDEGAIDAGMVYLLLGNALSATTDITDTQTAWTGTATSTALGEQALLIADVDGNGSLDQLIGSAANNPTGDYAGVLYLLSGDSIPTEHTSVEESAQALWTGETTQDYAGRSVTACDVNGDGTDDIFTGAYRYDYDET
ncbi:FG-GAP repeat protein, partial [Candidatus Uhrbacteria bacterium]|nr:FG-GAP repeat protein [Candidatus Uhrbacteria bacterium]